MKESLVSLYYYFIYPYLIYCNHVWGLACKTNLDYLIKLQKRAIRIIVGVHPRTHTEPLFQKIKLLKCEDINRYLIGRLMFRIQNNELPIFQNFFKRNRDIHSHDTRQKDYFHIPPFKTKLGKANLRYNGASIWNVILKVGIDTKSSEFQFAKSLRARYYLEIYIKKYLTITDFPVTCCHAILSSLAPGRCSCNPSLKKNLIDIRDI